MTLEGHGSNLCKKANQKLNSLAPICHYMNSDKLKVIMKAFIVSQFSYCPLIWMFHKQNSREGTQNCIQRQTIRYF